MLSPEVLDYASRSVLCWLATVDESGQPNVSPKEIFAGFDAEHAAETTEQSQVQSAMRTYRVQPERGDA